MRHIIDAVAAQGRGDDTELLHVTKGELRGLDSLARRHFGRELPRNPRTGLKEASLFRDWFGNDVGMALDVAAPVALGFTGVGAPAAIAMGAGLGAANQGLGKGGTTESALMGGVMGGIGAYGGTGLAEGLGTAGTSAATPTATTGLTPTATAGADLGVGSYSNVAANLPGTATLPASEVATTALPGGAAGETLSTTNMLAQPSGATGVTAPTGSTGTGLKLGTDTAGSTNVLNSTTNTSVGGGQSLQATNSNGTPITSMGADTSGIKWDYLGTKDALSPMTAVGTSALGTMEMPGAPADTTGTTTTGINKTLPKAEVYYTPYGERRTRIVGAAEGGLMGFADYDATDADKDGGYAPGGIASYDFGGFVKSIQPGGAWGEATADMYGAMDKALPFMKDITPGGAVGQLQPGRRDWEEKKRQEEEAKANEEKAKADAAAKAAKDAAFQQQWQNRYNTPVAMAEGGSTGEGTPMLPSWVPDSSKTILGKDSVKIPAGASVQDREYLKALMALQNPGVYTRRRQNMAEGGIASFGQGRYLQGPGDGMSDSIKANIDGKQEARLATGEFVVPADVVSHLGNGDSTAGAKQLHNMMDRARMTRTGTKKQGKQINPRKVMPA